jgi:hypothetical protein
MSYFPKIIDVERKISPEEKILRDIPKYVASKEEEKVTIKFSDFLSFDGCNLAKQYNDPRCCQQEDEKKVMLNGRD